MMPEGLLDMFKEIDILDLMAYSLLRGDPQPQDVPEVGQEQRGRLNKQTPDPVRGF